MAVSEIMIGLMGAREHPQERYDVAILGGGLAGLTLALQLRQESPDASIFVANKRSGPAPEAAFKVGESTVDVSAHYFANVVGMKDHIDERQNPKFGLRYFLPANGNRDITKRFEVGPSDWYVSKSYQLDRGRFENELWRRVIRAGVDAFDGTRITDVELGGAEDHTIAFSREDETGTLRARWVLDATGRGSFMKRKLGLLKDVSHTINSSWFRLAGGLDYEEWGKDDRAWLDRMSETGIRHLSTTHLMGEGYWIWLIPLRSGPISIGVCADQRFHPFERINTFEALLGWLQEFEPQLHDAVSGRLDQVEDFLKIEDFAFGSERVYSPERWCLTGEAGVFADPFYSPGSDFIAMGNTLTTDLVARDLKGEDVSQRTEVWNTQLLTIFDAFLQIYTDLYTTFGNPRVLVPKVAFDHAIYWCVSCFRFIQGKVDDLDDFQQTAGDLIKASQLMGQMAGLFKEWHEHGTPATGPGFVSISDMEPLMEVMRNFLGEMDNEEAVRRFAENVRITEAMAVQIFAEAVQSTGVAELDEEQKINPYGASLDPSRWEQDGLHDGTGFTLAEARERVPGLAEPLHVQTLATA